MDLFFVQGFSFLGFLENLGFVGYVLLFLHSRFVRFYSKIYIESKTRKLEQRLEQKNADTRQRSLEYASYIAGERKTTGQRILEGIPRKSK